MVTEVITKPNVVELNQIFSLPLIVVASIMICVGTWFIYRENSNRVFYTFQQASYFFLLSISFWIVLSITMVIFNKYIFCYYDGNGFPLPLLVSSIQVLKLYKKISY